LNSDSNSGGGNLTGFGAITEVEVWGEGVYLLPVGQKTGIVVIHQLPETPDTLWLRLLGKGNIRKRAIEEINRLTNDNPYRDRVLQLLSDLKVVLETKKNRDNEDRELLMSLRTSPLYLEHLENIRREAYEQALKEGLEQGREQALKQGLEQGENRGKREITLKQLNRKLGNLSAELITRIDTLSSEKLDDLSKALLDFQVVGDLIVWLNDYLPE
jgi:hypothetical protein